MLSPMIRPILGLLATLALATPTGVEAQLVRQQNTTLTLPAELPVATGYTTVNAIPFQAGGGMAFLSPICTAFPPGETNRLYVAERGSATNQPRVQVVNSLSAPTPSQAVFLNLGVYLAGLGTPVPVDGENGLLSFAFHPNYNQNGYFYCYFSITIAGQLHQRVARFQATGTPGSYNAAASANPATMAPLLTIRDEATNHNGGTLHFGPDGYLYLSLGDEGGGGDFYNNARFINKDFWGQMLRLDVDNDPANLVPNAHAQANSTSHPSAIHAGTYRVPADNPFIGATTWHGRTFAAGTVRTEIFATGFRNPFRFSIDAPTGRIFLGDVGQGSAVSYEEIDLVIKGGDYGWSWREGMHPFYQSATVPPRFPDNTAGNTNAEPVSGFNPINPIFEYDRTNDGVGSDSIVYGVSVCGGVIYRGNQLTELVGAYLFAEIYGNNAIVALRETSPGVWAAQRLTTRSQIVHIGTDPRNGEPLLCSLLNQIYKLQRSGTTGTPPPATLSATGVFTDLATLTPNAGVVAYETNVAFWSDYAIKSRWFAIRNLTDTVAFSPDGNWTLPTGMVWVKHFDIDTTRGNPATRRKLETRLLVKTATDVYGLSYKWRADQTNADLVAEEGLTEAVPSSVPAQTWRYPSRGECRTCHTAVGGFALTFNTRQMNRAHLFGAQTQNQISALSCAGYFTTPVTGANTLPAFAPAGDATASLEWRVRSYLAVNCVQCHQPGGASTGYWDARATTPTDLANLINGPLVNDGGDSANRWCIAGDTAHSMILKRLAGTGVQRMPPLTTSERDLVAETLIADWINQGLPARLSVAQWQTLHFGSPGATNAALTADPDKDGQRNDLEFMTGSDPLNAVALWAPSLQTAGSNYQLTFPHTANRAFLIETSTDLQAWSLWDVPGNSPDYPATTQSRTVTGPMDASAARFFRFRILEQ